MSSEENDDPVCRICFETEPAVDLFSPCGCTGSTQWVHRQCLDRWRAVANPACNACEVCNVEYKYNRQYSTADTLRIIRTLERLQQHLQLRRTYLWFLANHIVTFVSSVFLLHLVGKSVENAGNVLSPLKIWNIDTYMSAYVLSADIFCLLASVWSAIVFFTCPANVPWYLYIRISLMMIPIWLTLVFFTLVSGLAALPLLQVSIGQTCVYFAVYSKRSAYQQMIVKLRLSLGPRVIIGEPYAI